MRFFFITILLLIAFSVRAENSEEKELTAQTAITSDGRKVILKSNGTWEYLKEEEPEPQTAPAQQASPPQPPPVVVQQAPAPAPVPPSPPVTAASKEVQKSALSFQAAMPLKSGAVQPISGTTFYLLDQDLTQILQSSGMKPEKGLSLLNTFSIAHYGFSMGVQRAVKAFSSAMESIQPHIVATSTSNVDGKGEFPSVPAGTYHMMSVSVVFLDTSGLTDRKSILWNVRVQVQPGQNSITLNETNAVR